jgi:hypothetical protein
VKDLFEKGRKVVGRKDKEPPVGRKVVSFNGTALMARFDVDYSIR